MRFGCCVGMFSSKSDPIGRSYLPVLKELNYDFAELPLAQVMDLSNNEFISLVEELHELSLPCDCCNNFLPGFLRLTGEKTAPAGVLDAYLEKALYRASALGAKIVIFGSSGAKNIPEGYPYQHAYEQIVFMLKRVAAVAEPYGIIIGVEPLNCSESNLICNLREGAQLVKDVGSAQVRLMADYYHFSRENETMEILDLLADELVHLHISSPPDRVFPHSNDMEFLACLKEKGYDGGISLEACTDNPYENLVKARIMFSKYE